MPSLPVLSPAHGSRRRRRGSRLRVVLGGLVLAALVAVGGTLAYRAYTREDRAGAVRDALQRYAAAWRRQDYAGMYRLLTPAAQRRAGGQTSFVTRYRRAL